MIPPRASKLFPLSSRYRSPGIPLVQGANVKNFIIPIFTKNKFKCVDLTLSNILYKTSAILPLYSCMFSFARNMNMSIGGCLYLQDCLKNEQTFCVGMQAFCR